MSALLGHKSKYDPSVDYYFVDYHLIKNPQWVRSPYNTIEEVQQIIENLPYVWDSENEKLLPMFTDLRITPYSNLTELYRVWNEEENEWQNDTITKGCVLFGSRYEHHEFYGMPASLTKEDEETREEWEARVAAHDADYQQNIRPVVRANHKSRIALWDEFSNENVAYTVGKMMQRMTAEKVAKQAVED